MSNDDHQRPRRKGGKPRTAQTREAAALALAQGSTIRAAAEQVGIGDKTLRRWRQEPDFVALVAQFRAEITDQTIGLEARLRSAALIRAGQALPNPDDRIGIRAADVLLRNTGRNNGSASTDEAEGTLLAYLRSLG